MSQDYCNNIRILSTEKLDSTETSTGYLVLDETGNLNQVTNPPFSFIVSDGTNSTEINETDNTLTFSAGSLITVTNTTNTINYDFADGTQGDIFYYNGTSWVTLGIGSEDQVLQVQSGQLVYNDLSANNVSFDITDGVNTETIDVTAGDDISFFGESLIESEVANSDSVIYRLTSNATAGDIITYNGNDWVKLPIGNPDQVLTVNSTGDGVEYSDIAQEEFIDKFTTGTTMAVGQDTFTLSNPVRASIPVKIYLNGVLQRENTDYTISGGTVILSESIDSGDQHLDIIY